MLISSISSITFISLCCKEVYFRAGLLPLMSNFFVMIVWDHLFILRFIKPLVSIQFGYFNEILWEYCSYWRFTTDDFYNMFAHSCASMPTIWTQIRPYLGPKYAIFKISSIWFIRFQLNFVETFLIWEDLRRISLVTCSPILAWAWPWFRQKSGHIRS